MSLDEILKKNHIENYKIKYDDSMEFLVDIRSGKKTIYLHLSENDMYRGYTVDVLCKEPLTIEEKTKYFHLAEEIKKIYSKKIRLLSTLGVEKAFVRNATIKREE